MHYTYILESLSHPTQHYIGHSSDLKARLIAHNAGKCRHTSAHRHFFLDEIGREGVTPYDS